jgi:hypothetical protein
LQNNARPVGGVKRDKRGGSLALFFRRSWFARLIENEGLYPRKFLLKSGDEIMGPIFKQNDKTERKKHEKNDPKETA